MPAPLVPKKAPAICSTLRRCILAGSNGSVGAFSHTVAAGVYLLNYAIIGGGAAARTLYRRPTTARAVAAGAALMVSLPSLQAKLSPEM